MNWKPLGGVHRYPSHRWNTLRNILYSGVLINNNTIPALSVITVTVALSMLDGDNREDDLGRLRRQQPRAFVLWVLVHMLCECMLSHPYFRILTSIHKNINTIELLQYFLRIHYNKVYSAINTVYEFMPLTTRSTV